MLVNRNMLNDGSLSVLKLLQYKHLENVDYLMVTFIKNNQNKYIQSFQCYCPFV